MRIETIGLRLIIVILILRSVANGQPVAPSLQPDVPWDRHLKRQWSADDGFPSNFVREVIQSQDGYIWIATMDGVVRFDGHHFQVFNRASVAELPTDDIRTLYESRDGSLWIGSSAGLTEYNPGRPGVFSSINALKGYHIEEIFEDRTGTMWIGTRTATWSAKVGDPFRLDADAPGHVKAICEDREGTLWFGSAANGLYRVQNRGFGRVTADEDSESLARDVLDEAGVNALLADEDGSLWIGTNLGLLRKAGEFEIHTEGLDGNGTMDILQTRSGSLYVTTGNRLMLWTGRSLEVLADGNGASLCEDREGSLWACSTDGVVRQYRNNWTSLALQGESVQCILEDDLGTMWLGTASGLRRVTNGEVTRIVDGLPHPLVRTIAAGKESLWIGTPKGLARWSDGELTTVPATEDLNIATVYEDSTGVVWMGLFHTGVYRLEDESVATVQAIEGHVHWFHEDADGILWIGDDIGLRRQVDNRIELVSDHNFDSLARATLSYYADGDDLWLSSLNGIARYRAGRFDVFTTREGLLAERVFNLHGDHHGNLWMATPRGFYYASLQALDDVAAGRAQRVDCHWIEQDYGASILGEVRSFPKACRADDGTTWFANSGPVLRVHADPIPKNLLAPPVIIEQATVDNAVVDANQPFDFLSGRRRVEMSFSVPSFFRPERIQVKYRLNGYDTDWVEANSERVASYVNLRPGDYELRVIAHNGDGIWNEEGDTLCFTVVPRWFETFWFRTSGVLLVFAAIFGVVTLRMRSLRGRHEERQRHREELARVSRVTSMGELAASIAHEVNQPLCAILNDAHSGLRILASEEYEVEDAQEETFEDIATAAKRASHVIEHIRQLLAKHSAEHQPLDITDVLCDSLDIVRFNLAERDIELVVDPKPILPPVLGDRVQLQQVLINLVSNAAHAIASARSEPRIITVQPAHHNNDVTVSVRDTGVGFGQDQNLDRLFDAFYTTKENGIGMGLAITKTIVESHGGRIWAERNADRGATFTFTIPVVSGTENA